MCIYRCVYICLCVCVCVYMHNIIIRKVHKKVVDATMADQV